MVLNRQKRRCPARAVEPLGGVAHVTSTLDQYEKIFELTGPSASNCMLFCQGCVTEMSPASRNGGTVYDAITRMASQDKIGWVHFRNVAGTGAGLATWGG
jgi:D-mannonate dehydratase